MSSPVLEAARAERAQLEERCAWHREAPVTERIVLGPGEFLLDALTGSDDPKEDG